MEYDVSILQLQRLLKGIDFQDAEKGASALAPIFLKYPDKIATLIYYMALSINKNQLLNFMNDSKLGSLMINSFAINQHWFFKAISNLHLHKFLYEIIEYGPLSISNLILQMAVDLLKTEGNLHCTDIYKVLIACYNKIIYLNTTQNTQSNIDSYAKELTNIMTSYIVKNLQSPDENLVIRSGLLAVEFMIVLENCFNKIYEYESFDEKKIQFYKLDSEYIDNDQNAEEIIDLEAILTFLLSQLETIFTLVSCDTWITWEEGNFETSTIQELIGNKIFNINERLTYKKHNLSNTLQQCFKQFQIKPKTEEDEISNASLNEIVDRIQTMRCKHILKWYSALMTFTDVWHSSKLMSFMLSHIEHACTPMEVMKKCLDFITKNPQEIQLKDVFLRVWTTFSLSDQKELLTEICNKQYINVFRSNDNEENIIITFNKFSTSSDYEELMKELIVLFVQRPLQVVLFIFKFAITSKENHDMCIHIINQLQCVWKLNFDTPAKCIDEYPFLTLSLQHLFIDCIEEKGVNNLANLLNSLTKKLSYNFPVASLIQYLVTMIDENLIIENWENSRFFLILLKSISLNGIEENTKIVLLAFMAQVALKTSWDVESFSKGKVEVNKVSCEVISELINSTSCADCNWLKDVLNKVEKSVKTHFCTIWLNHNLKFPDEKKFYLKLLLAIRSNNVYVINLEENFQQETGNHQRLSTLLSLHHLKIIPIIHKSEWFPLFNNCVALLMDTKVSSPYLAAFEIFSNSMTMLAISCDSKTYSCFEFCMGSFSDIFNLILPSLPSDDFIQFFKCLLKPLKKIACSSVKDNSFYLVLPILLTSVKNYLESNLKVYDNYSLLPFVSDMEEKWRTDFTTSFNVKILN